MTEDAELVARSRRRDAEAFGALVERHQRLVVGVALARCGDPALAEDIAQEAFVTAWRDLDRLRDGERVGPWVAGIARNLAASAVRTQARRNAPIEVASLVPSPEDEALEREDRELLARALADVPETHREVLVRYYLGGDSVAAIATALGVREDLVKQRLSRGRRALREGVLARVDSALERARPRRLGGVLLIMTTKKVAIAAVAVVLAIGGATAWYVRRPAATELPTKPGPADPASGSQRSLHVRRLADPARHAVMLEAIRERRAQRTQRAAGTRSSGAGPAGGTTQGGTGVAPTLPTIEDEKDYILAALVELKPLLSECYEEGLERDPKLAGSVVLDFTLEGEPEVGGVVGNSTIIAEESTLGDPTVRECIQQTMYALELDAPASGELRVRNEFAFAPGD